MMRIHAVMTVAVLAALAVSSAGCARMKEGARGALGISTRVLERERPRALSQSVPLPYAKCMEEAAGDLAKMGCYTYADKPAQGMIAVYVSDDDSTPVGVFFTKVDEGNTKVEVSSQSTYAKEYVSQRLFAMLTTPAVAPAAAPAPEVKKDEPAK